MRLPTGAARRCVRAGQFALIFLLASPLAGCVDQPVRPNVAAYYGPTDPMARVVSDINANASKIQTLRTLFDFEATIVDEKGHSNFVNGDDGILVYRKPQELVLRAKKAAVGSVFEIGSNDEQFWFTDFVASKKMWFGDYRNLGKPCTRDLPVRPDLILEVLGAAEIDTNFINPPVPTMRFNNDTDAYMFVWNVRAPGRWIAQREIWYDRTTKLPKLVLLFDDDGRIILRAYLSKPKPVRTDGVAEAAWPKLATTYDLFFPQTRSRMTLSLHNLESSRNGVPNDANFRLPDPSVDHVRVDADCHD